MTDLLDRLIWLSLGMVLGFVLGLIVATLRELKEEVSAIDEIVRTEHGRNETGFMRYPVIADFMLIVVLVIVVAGAFSAQNASNKTDQNQAEISKITDCNQEFLTGTIEALNERTTYTQVQATRNIELQEAQSRFLAILLDQPPPSDRQVRDSLSTYFNALNDFVDINAKTRMKADEFPYPTTQDYESCIEEK